MSWSHSGGFYLGLIDGVGDLVWEDAGGQAGHNLGHISFMCRTQHVVIDGEVVSLEETKPSIQKQSDILSSL